MPARLARSSVQIAAPKNARNKNGKRNLDAFAIASHSTAQNPRLKPSRFGEYINDGPRQKRRRAVESEDGEEDSVEEDVPAPQKRRRNAGPEDDEVEEGSDSEGNEWAVGGLREGEEDSEVDSDEAFGESDDEKFDGFTFRGSRQSGGGAKRDGSKRTKAREQLDEDEDGDMDLDEGASESEDEEEDDFGDEGVDLATMLDDEDDEMLGGNDPTQRDLGEESASDDQDEEPSASEQSSDSEQEDENDGNEEERNARMRDRLEALDSHTQQHQPVQSQPPTKALTVDDLLSTLDPSQRKQFASTIKTRKKSSQPKTLTAPLPKRQQDSLDRAAASAKAKEQLDRWQDTVIRNRRAEFLEFPLKDPSKGPPQGQDRFVVGGEEEPANELEENVRRIMVESGLASGINGDDDEGAALIKAEELATNKLPVEEVMRRRAELRKARELLFREERKAKRIKKIKSHAFRRVHRKERQRIAENEKALQGDGVDFEDEKERQDRKRAEARMSTKHRDSKWAKQLKETNRAVWDEGARDGVMEQARREEELKRRVRGESVESERGSDVVTDSDGDDEEFDGFGKDVDEDEQILRRLDRVSGSDAPASGKESKGLGSMKFMRAADERQRAQNNEDVERLRKEIAVQDGDEDESHEEGNEDEGLGRAIFGPNGRDNQEAPKKPARPVSEEGDVEHKEPEEEQDVTIVTEATDGEKNRASGTKRSIVASGPLANGLERDRKPPEKTTQDTTDSDWLLKPRKKSKGDTHTTQQYIEMGSIHDMANSDEKSITSASKATNENPATSSRIARDVTSDAASGNTNGWTQVVYKDQDQDKDSDAPSDADEPSDPMLSAQDKKKSYYDRAFGGEDVQTTFDAEKSLAAESEDEKETSTHLPGWGSWTGSGLSKSIKRSNARQRHNPLYKSKLPGTKPEDRKDKKLENVIISEKQNRKGKVYQAPILPHGFETKGQYERSLRLPLGPEWSTKEVFQKGTRPRVVVKPGVVVAGMERPLV